MTCPWWPPSALARAHRLEARTTRPTVRQTILWTPSRGCRWSPARPMAPPPTAPHRRAGGGGHGQTMQPWRQAKPLPHSWAAAGALPSRAHPRAPRAQCEDVGAGGRHAHQRPRSLPRPLPAQSGVSSSWQPLALPREFGLPPRSSYTSMPVHGSCPPVSFQPAPRPTRRLRPIAGALWRRPSRTAGTVRSRGRRSNMTTRPR